MSLPEFPQIDQSMTLENSLNMILTSIAMEEAGLSHIINAEGEKIQYILGMNDKKAGHRVSPEEVLAVNNSVKGLLDSVLQTQLVLKSKMENALGALEYLKPCPPQPCPPQPCPPQPCPPKPCPPKPCPEPGCDCGCRNDYDCPHVYDNCHAAAFPGCPGQCWCTGRPLKWVYSNCSCCPSLYLSPDGCKIILKHGKCYTVSFSADLCAVGHECRNVAVGVQTFDHIKKTNHFTCHAGVPERNEPFTISAAGIFIPKILCDTELMLTLLSPGEVNVKQSSITIMEI